MEEDWGEYLEPKTPSCLDFQPSALQQVRNWIRKQRFIPCDLSNEFIQRFLNRTNDDVERAVKKIKAYFYLRQAPWPIFRDRNPLSQTNRKFMGPLYAVPLRNLYTEGEVILLTGLLEQTTRYSLLAHLKLVALVVDYLLWDENNTFTDLKILLNGENFTCPAPLDNPHRRLTRFLRQFTSSLPINLVGFYILRPPIFAEEILRVHDGIWFTLIEDPRDVAYIFPVTLLPSEFGGNLCLLDELLDMWNLQLQEGSEFYEQFERRMVNDYRRRLCHEKEMRDGGRNWVHKMKLVEEVSQYKKCYYERMANFKPQPHPGFGDLRVKPKTEPATAVGAFQKCREFVLDDKENKFALLRPIKAAREARQTPPCRAVNIEFYTPVRGL